MKKNVLQKILVLAFMFFPCKMVFANTGSVSISCSPTSIKVGSTTNCTIKASTDFNFEAYEMVFTVGSKLELVSYEAAVKASDASDNEIKNGKVGIVLGKKLTGSNITLGTLKVKVKSDATVGNDTISINNIVLTGENDDDNAVANTSTSVTVTASSGSTTALLKSLGISGGSLKEGYSFDPQLTDYFYELPSSATSFTLNPVAQNSSDVVKIVNFSDESVLTAGTISYDDNNGNGGMNINIFVGENTVPYKIFIYKKTAETYTAKLKTLVIGGKSISLTNGIPPTSVEVSSLKNVEYTATLDDTTHFEFDATNDDNGILTDGSDITIAVVPKSGVSGATGAVFTIHLTQKSSSSSSGSSSKDSTSKSSSTSINSNPNTGDISIFIVTMILFVSLITGLIIYRKNYLK